MSCPLARVIVFCTPKDLPFYVTEEDICLGTTPVCTKGSFPLQSRAAPGVIISPSKTDLFFQYKECVLFRDSCKNVQ